MVSTAVRTTRRFYQLLPHSDSHSRKPAVGVPPCPGKSPGASPAVHSGLCSCTSARCRLDPPVTFTTMCTLGTSPPPAVYLQASGLILVIGLYAVQTPVGKLCSRGKTHQQPGLPQLPVNPQLAPALAAYPGPHHYMHICTQPLPLHRHLPLVPTAKCMHITGSSHHSRLLWSLTEGSGGSAEDPKCPCSH